MWENSSLFRKNRVQRCSVSAGCFSLSGVQEVAMEQTCPVLLRWRDVSICSLLNSRLLLPLQNSRCGRASLRPLRLCRGYATPSGEPRCVGVVGGWNWFFCWLSERGICSLVPHESKSVMVGFFLLLSNSCSHGFVCSMLYSVRFKWG